MKIILNVLFCAFICCSTTIHAAEFTDGPRARNAMTSQIKKLFEERKFSELENMAKSYRTSKSRQTDGVWNLLIFYTSFDLPTYYPESAFPKYIALAEEWRRAFPKSVTAQSVLADIWSDYAWKERGGDFAVQVKNDAWPIVNKRLNKSWEIVNEPLATGVADCPYRHYVILSLAKVRRVERSEYEALFQKATHLEPGFHHLYAAKSDFLLPKWGGSEGEWQRFIIDVANRNPGGEGATIYARTAWSMYLSDNWKNFKSTGVAWERMKAGFAEIDRNYPNSAWILNNTAKFACIADDKETFRILSDRINKSNYYQEAWGEDLTESSCRKRLGLPPKLN